MTTVRLEHIRAIKLANGKPLCASGTRAWFRQHGFDWADFLNNGIDAELLRATGDHWALMAVANAEVDDGR